MLRGGCKERSMCYCLLVPGLLPARKLPAALSGVLGTKQGVAVGAGSGGRWMQGGDVLATWTVRALLPSLISVHVQSVP